MPEYQYRKIPAAAIQKSFPYLCRHALKNEALEQSVARYGILQPLIVTQDSQPFLVSGHARFQAAIEAGLSELPALVLQDAYPKEDLFFFALLANWNHPLSELDRACALRRAAEEFHFDEGRILQEILPAIGLPAEKNSLDEYLQVAKLNPGILELIAAGKLPFRGARILGRFTQADQIEFVSIGKQAALTTNQLLKTCEWLLDLLKSSGESLKQYLTSSSLRSLLEKPSEDRRLRAEQFFQAVRSLRFPQLTNREKEFARAAQEIQKGSQDWRLEAPPYFEGEGILLHAKLRSPESLQKVVSSLTADRKLLNSLFEIML